MLSALIPSRLSYSAVLLAEQPMHQGSVQHGPLVLVSDLRKFPAPTTDRDRTVSRRSEPSSRATLMGEQPNPWDLLQPQDVTSRHRGAKPLRRYELLGGISLLSPEYLLSLLGNLVNFNESRMAIALIACSVMYLQIHTGKCGVLFI